MITINGRQGRLCDGLSRRELLEVGGSSLLGLSLASFFKSSQAQAGESPLPVGGPGFGKAKSVIFCFLQGGPSHLDIWDPSPKPRKTFVASSSRSKPKPQASSSPNICPNSRR